MSGLVVRLGTRTDKNGFTLVVLDHTKLMLTPEYPAFIDFCVRNNINLALQAVGPKGHFPVSCDLNTLVAKAVQEQDSNAILIASLDALKSMLENHLWESDGLALRSSLSTSCAETAIEPDRNLQA
ncbi:MULTISPECIES: hypothetical protein [unclassified Bradyrhizobium]|uniref:hypothetical protein n=1 Tax=unclassified Bradyrhizobium TaxID=2631580 RepID=UPI0029171334|nr:MULTISPECIES: hypothetical protein [unclassified Bradyrhizobium]